MCGGGGILGAINSAINDVGSVVSSAVSDVGNVVGGAADAVTNVVNQAAKNPLGAAALLAGGFAFAPEIGAWVASDGTALAGDATGVAAGTAPATAADLTASTVPATVPSVAPTAVSDTLAVPTDTSPYSLASTNPQITSGSLANTGGAQGFQVLPSADTSSLITTPNPVTQSSLAGIGEGLTASDSANLATMGGGQGLTAPASMVVTDPITGALVSGSDAAALASGTPIGQVGATGLNTGLLSTAGASGVGTGIGNLANAAAAGAAAAGAGNAASNAAGAAGGAAAGGATAGGGGGATTLASMIPALTAGNIASSLIGANAASKAAATQAAASNQAQGQLGNLYSDITAKEAPFLAAGNTALSNLTDQMPYLTSQFTPQDFAAGIDPGYAFRLAQGQRQVQNAANARGMTGNALTGLQDYTQGLASQEYQNAFNRYQTQRNNIYNTLAGIAGLGQTAAGQTVNAANAYGQNLANLITGSAAAQAAGQIGVANAATGGLNNVLNNYTLASLLNQNPSVGATTSATP